MESGAPVDGALRSLVLLRMGGRGCAVGCEAVVEIIPRVLLSAVPDAPWGVLGAINLRGKVVPVVDVRARISGNSEIAPYQHLVIVQSGARLLGVAVDDVEDVVTVDARTIEKPGELGRVHAPGIVRIHDELVLVLGPDDFYAATREAGAAPPGERGV